MDEGTDIPIAKLTQSTKEVKVEKIGKGVQFTDEAVLEKERRLAAAMLDIRKKYGANSLLKGLNFQKGATAIERNSQIGGHKA